MEIKKSEILDFLSANPDCLVTEVPLSDVKAYHSYTFKSRACGHEFTKKACHIRINKSRSDLCCPFCDKKRDVITGVNDLKTVRPDLVDYLINKVDAEKYSIKSNAKLHWSCPVCGYDFFLSPNKMSTRKNLCKNCSVSYSFGEVSMKLLLEFLLIPYVWHYKPLWSNNREYDFFLPEYNTIIEIHGKQHYVHNGFERLSKVTLEEAQYIDYLKKEQAKDYIKEYFIIDYSKEDFLELKSSIIQSGLFLVLNVNQKEIDWEYIFHEATRFSPLKKACELFNSGLKMVEICSILGCSRSSLYTYLKRGSEIGLCNYNPEQILKETYIKNGLTVVKNMSKPILQFDLNGVYIGEFSSIQQAQRVLGISHIWDVLSGKRKSSGGYLWKYK